MSESSGAISSARSASAWFSRPAQRATHTEQRFECDSRGDRVPGTLWLPHASGRERLVLALHPLGMSVHDAELAATAARGAAAGFAFAAIDLPLHGERHNAKLSRRAVAAACAGDASADAALWRSLVAQAVADLSAVLDALAGAAPARVATLAFAGTPVIARAHAAADARVDRLFAIGREESIPGAAAKPIAWLARSDDLSAALAQW